LRYIVSFVLLSQGNRKTVQHIPTSCSDLKGDMTETSTEVMTDRMTGTSQQK